MRFKPKTDAEIEADRMANSGILPAGTYECEVHSAEDTVSKNGNDMIKMGLRVYDAGGVPYFVFDYLLEAIAHKLRHAAVALGMAAAYDAGTLIGDDMIGRTCRVRLRVEKDKNGQFPDKNVVVDYLAPAADAPPAPPTRQPAMASPPTRRPQWDAPSRNTIEDDIPF